MTEPVDTGSESPLQQETEDFESAMNEAVRLVKFARFDAASEILDLLAQTHAHDSRVHFTRGMIAQRTGEITDAISHYKIASTLEPKMDQAAESMGVLLRGSINPVRAALTTSIESSKPFLYVIGSSYTRSFGVGSGFLPLMTGTADKLTFLTPELSALSTSHLLAHLERCDHRYPVLLALGNSDAIGHDQNTAKTRDLQASGELGSDDEIIEAAAHRLALFIETARDRFPDLQLLVLCACPVLTDTQVPMIKITNRVLKDTMAKIDVPFIDVFQDLVDPRNGLLHTRHCSTEGNAHLAKESIPVIAGVIEELGLLPESDANFQWSHMMRFRITDVDETRLWTEPHLGAENLRQSRLNHFNYVLERAVNHLISCLAFDGSTSVLVANAREGYVPLALPIELCRQLTAAESDVSRRHMLQRLAHFTGRSDIHIVAADPASPLSGYTSAHDVVFGVIHRDDDHDELDDVLEDWASLATEKLCVMGFLDWNLRDLSRLEFEDIRVIDLSASFLDADHRSASLLVLSR